MIRDAAELLTRAGRPPAAPVRMVHLGLGNFFRAHQAWYTAHAPDAPGWGIAGFTGRSAAVAHRLDAQGGLYTLITRGTEDRFETVSSLSRVHSARDHAAWLSYFAGAELAVVTLTVTEAGYTRARGGGLDQDDPAVVADIAALRADPSAPGRTAVARLVAGLAARRAASAAPLAVVPCDNLPDNGTTLARIVGEFADLVAPGLRRWIDANISFVTSMVDRITPATTARDIAAVAAATGVHDAAPVVTEPFHEWVLCGEFPAGRPQWDEVGVRFTNDIVPYEQRKLWLLNGAHSLLAYAAPDRGHRTVAEAIADPVCRAWVRQWWCEAAPRIALPPAEVSGYLDSLLRRFANPRMHHQLSQIARDGSQKLPARVVPVLRAERAAGRMPEAAVRIVAGWTCHLRDPDARADDPPAAGVRDAAGALAVLDSGLAQDDELCRAVAAETQGLRQRRAAPRGGEYDALAE
ncbi:mannitol dehydrogenase family protein [Nocardia goodfellowii]